MKWLIAVLALALSAACGGRDAEDPAPATISGAWRIDAGGCVGYMALDHGAGPWGGTWACTPDDPGGSTPTLWAGAVFSWVVSQDGEVELDLGMLSVTGQLSGGRIVGTTRSAWIGGWASGQPFVATAVPN